MRHLGITLSVTCNASDVLTKLRDNRAKHAGMVAEARTGYVEQARAALEKKLAALREGKVESVLIGLHTPKDYTEAYDTTISMLSMHQGESVELNADEFRHLMEDTWDWTADFVTSNSRFSPSTRAYAVGKGLDV